AEALERLADGALDVLGDAHVALKADDLGARLLADDAGRLLEQLGPARGNRHRAALFREQPRRCAADSLARAGDERDRAFQTGIHWRLLGGVRRSGISYGAPRVKPVAFAYHRVASVDEAVERLASLGEDAKVLAGGQSLVPMMNFRLVRPA